MATQPTVTRTALEQSIIDLAERQPASDWSGHDAVGDLIELAGTYFADGAPRSAAVRLRLAAMLCEQIADAREAALASQVSA